VIQGLPVISGKQLGKSGIVLKAHHHHLDAVNLAPAAIDPGRTDGVTATGRNFNPWPLTNARFAWRRQW